MKALKINVRPKDGGFAYRIGAGINAITGWTRSKERVAELVDAYERRRGGSLRGVGRGPVGIKIRSVG